MIASDREMERMHTIFAPKSIHLGSRHQGHIPQDGLARIIELEAVLRRVHIVTTLCPFPQEVAWGFAAKAIIVGHETQEWEPTR